MISGILIDNLNEPVESTYTKLAKMQPGVVGTLWTRGTRHGTAVYNRFYPIFGHDGLKYIVIRVDGDTPEQWVTEADAALAAVHPDWQGKVVFGVLNEPNLEGVDDPVAYGRFYTTVCELRPQWASKKRLLFACPSFGKGGAMRYLEDSLTQVPFRPPGAINLYASEVGRIDELLPLFRDAYVTEMNILEQPRIEWLRATFDELERKGVKAAIVFIAGGVPGYNDRGEENWPSGYIISEEEAAALRRPQTEEQDMTFARIGNLDVQDLRADLPDEPGKMDSVPFTDKDFISIHHTATPATTTAKAIYDYHKGLGWGGIGYNFLIFENGIIQYVGECNTERAAVGQISQGNRRGIHIALVGDYSDSVPPAPMLNATKKLIAELQTAYGWWMPFLPHCMFNSGGKWDTVCPGAGWRQWWKLILRAVGE